jgi:hypothetical protein
VVGAAAFNEAAIFAGTDTQAELHQKLSNPVGGSLPFSQDREEMAPTRKLDPASASSRCTTEL